HATIDFVSRSTPLAGNGIVTTNTDARILSNPSDGTFSVPLAAGNYQVTISAGGQSSTFNIAVPAGNGAVAIDTLIATPLTYPFVAPNIVWNGQWAGNITFLPIPAPPAPTSSLINFAGGNVNAAGDERYAYFVSYVTANGETNASPALQLHESTSGHASQANRILLQANPAGVTGVRIWRTYADNGHVYDPAGFPRNVGLLAVVSPATGYYDDWESTAQFAARVDTTLIPPLFNTSAGQLLSSNGTACAFITDQGLFFPGANCRIKPGQGLQIYNFTTKLWYTLLNSGALGAEQWSFDSGNPN
ncbi:MAG: hypothetical protein JWQ04_1643, partial [Pedosphaera sp.]|nr:hypothetical protein [Pedosphaera sp.]